MIWSMIGLLGSFFSTGIFQYVLVHIFALAFLATVPIIIWGFFRR